MPTNVGVKFGRECFREPETLKKEGPRNLQEKFAKKFAGNFLKFRQTKT